MEKFKIISWPGETIPIEVEWDTDITAQCTLEIYGDTAKVFEKTVTFVNNIADVSLTPAENLQVGVGNYAWLVRVDYSDGSADILPDGLVGCEGGDCSKPELIICEVVS